MSKLDFLTELEGIIQSRRTADGDKSYTKTLFDRGTPFIAQKVGEEAVELEISPGESRHGELGLGGALQLFEGAVQLCRVDAAGRRNRRPAVAISVESECLSAHSCRLSLFHKASMRGRFGACVVAGDSRKRRVTNQPARGVEAAAQIVVIGTIDLAVRLT